MIYTNLFKTNKANKAKTALHYAVESRKYKISFILDKKVVSMVYAMAIGAFLIVSINVGIYGVAVYSNNNNLDELSAQNDNYTNSVSALENRQDEYNLQKSNAENIYKISTRPTSWSLIISEIAAQLPYDGVLTVIESISPSEANTSINGDNAQNNNDNANTNTDTDTDTDTDNADSDSTPNTDTTPTPNTDSNSTPSTGTDAGTGTGAGEDSSGATISSIGGNSVVLIKGKSLSMVNISLFLDKLDGLQMFSKVECKKAQQSIDSEYYDFEIYAALNDSSISGGI